MPQPNEENNSLLNKYHPRKRFGQHFLIDSAILERIVRSFNPKSNQLILEIGPGTGILTQALLAQVDHIHAVELDRDLVIKLQNKFDPSQLTLIQKDILEFDLNMLASQTGSREIRLIGNLPYNISTPLLFHLLKSVGYISDMVFMLQKEVALRLSAIPGNKNYGRLSVMAAVHLSCECLFDVPPSAFNPPPKVESTVVRLTLRQDTPEIANPDRLSLIVKLAFSQRRKTLRNSLESVLSNDHFEKSEIDSSLRAENLSLDQFIQLSNC